LIAEAAEARRGEKPTKLSLAFKQGTRKKIFPLRASAASAINYFLLLYLQIVNKGLITQPGSSLYI